MSLSIQSRPVGDGAPCFIIAEVAQAHDGSLGMAHAFIDAIAKTGADAVKFQTHIAEAESTPDEPFRVRFSPQDRTRYDYWKRIEFTPEQWRGLADHCAERGLIFLSSPFSVQAVDLLASLNMPAYKIASGEVSNEPLLARICAERKPVLFSSGMSGWQELDRSIGYVRERGCDVAVMQCTTQYPCPPERLGLNVIAELRSRYRCPVGLSDHSGTIYAGLAATALGLDLLEVHVTLSREMFGPDVPASITTGELQQLVEGVRFIERALSAPLDKQAVEVEMQPLRQIFTQSVVAADDLPAGTILQHEHLATRKPGTGIPARALPDLIGRRLKQAVRRHQLLRYDMLE